MLSKRLVVVLLVFWPASLVAQAAPARTRALTAEVERSFDRPRGQRVRFTDLSDPTPMPLEGVLIRSSSDTLLLEVAGRSEPVLVVASRSTRMERWTRDDPTSRYVVAGVLLGAAVGGVTANWINEEPEPRSCAERHDDAVSAAACAFGAAIVSAVDGGADQMAAILVGVAVGGALGAFGGIKLAESRTREGWRPVAPTELLVAPTASGGVQLGLRFGF